MSTRKILGTLAVLSFASFTSACRDRATHAPATAPAVLDEISAATSTTSSSVSLGAIPAVFEANVGQVDARALFLARTRDYRLFLTQDAGWFVLSSADRAVAVRMSFPGSTGADSAVGVQPLASSSNYLIGDDSTQWKTAVPHFAGVAYHALYSGVDLGYRRDGGAVETVFSIAPGADPSSIAMAFSGADSVSIDDAGSLVVQTGLGPLVQHAPTAFQTINGQKQAVRCAFRMISTTSAGFALAAYDKTQPVTIDPSITFGGTGDNGAFLATSTDTHSVAAESGVVYVAGETSNSSFPATTGSYQQSYQASTDGFIAKFNASSGLVWATFLGGSSTDIIHGLAVDASGNSYVVGETTSSNFPRVDGTLTFGGVRDAFVAKLSSSGSSLAWSNYLGGSSADAGEGIAIDGSGNAYVTGYTASTNFPTANAAQGSLSGTQDAFVTEIHCCVTLLGTTQTTRPYSTYLGGTGSDDGHAIAVDANAKAYVTGETTSTNNTSPWMTSALQTTNNGGTDAFLTKLSSAGAIQYSSYLGGSGTDIGHGIAAYTSGGNDYAYVTGETSSSSSTWLSSSVPYGGGNRDAFVYENRTNTPSNVGARFLGGSGTDIAYSIALDAAHHVFLTGSTTSSNFPLTKSLSSQEGGSNGDAFVSMLESALASSQDYSTCLGWEFDATSRLGKGEAIAVDSADDAFIVGMGHNKANGQQTELAEISPFSAADDSYSDSEDATLTVGASVGVLANDDTVGPAKSATLVSGPAHGTVSLSADGSFTYTPSANYNGGDSFTYEITSDPATSNVATASLTISAVNDPPSFTEGGTQNVWEDAGAQTVAGWATNISAGPPDESEQALTFNVTNDTNPALFSAGPAIASNGTLTYTPLANANGSAIITIDLQDDGGRAGGGSDTSGTQSFTINVGAVNDAPSFTAGPNLLIGENSSAQTQPSWATNISAGPTADEASQALTFIVTADSDPSLFLVAPGVDASGTLTYTPAAHVNGTATIALELKDDGGTANGGSDTSAPQTFTITVADDAPIATADSFSTSQGRLLAVAAPGVLVNDYDADASQPLTAALDSPTSHGAVTLNADGSFAYSPNDSFSGTDSFTYHAYDGELAGTSSTVTISVTARTADDSATTSPGVPVTTSVLSNDTGFTWSPDPAAEETYCYDGYDSGCVSGSSDSEGTRGTLGRLSSILDKAGSLEMTYDHAGCETAETRSFIDSIGSFTTSYAYNEDGTIHQATYPDGVAFTRYYDAIGRENEIVWSAGGASGTLAMITDWYPFAGPHTWETLGGSVQLEQRRDLAGRVTFETANNGTAAEISYAYADDSNVDQISTDPSAPADGSSPNVAHDSLNRLTADRTGATYSWDDAGNRLSGPDGTLDYPDATSDRWDAASSGAVTYTLDAAGNVVQRGATSITMGDDGSVIGLDTPPAAASAEVRDYRSLRVVRQGVAGQEIDGYSPAGEIVERDLAPSDATCAGGETQQTFAFENYVYVAGRRIGLVQSHEVGPCGGGGGGSAVADTAALYFSDAVGMPRAVYRESDAKQVWSGDFDSFGNRITVNEDPDADGVAFEQVFRFPGQRLLASAEGGEPLIENWHRLYDAKVGRYLEPDSMTLGVERVTSPYAYASDTPLRIKDPRGTWGVCDPELDPDDCVSEQDVQEIVDDVNNLIEGLGDWFKNPVPKPGPTPQPLPEPTTLPATGPEPAPAPAPTTAPGGGGGVSCSDPPPGQFPDFDRCKNNAQDSGDGGDWQNYCDSLPKALWGRCMDQNFQSVNRKIGFCRRFFIPPGTGL